MDPGRWSRAKEIFHGALACEPGGREAYLREACAGDPSLRELAESMLAREPEAAGFLELPALHGEAMALAGELESAGGVGTPAIQSIAHGAGGEPASPGAGRPPAAWPAPGPAAGSPAGHPPAESSIPNPASGAQPAAPSRAPWWLYILAALFMADVLIRAWCHLLGPVGFGIGGRLEDGRCVVTSVTEGLPAERAGIRLGDALIACEAQPIQRWVNRYTSRPNLEAGRTYRFEFERDGQRLELAVMMRRVRPLGDLYWQSLILWEVAALMMMATALLIAFKRPREPVAGMGALTLAALSVSMYLYFLPNGYAAVWRSVPLGLGALLTVPNLAIPLVGAIGLTFFSLFPRPLFRSRWLWLLVWLPAVCQVPLFVRDTLLIVYDPAQAFDRISPEWIRPIQGRAFGFYGLAMLAAISLNYFRLSDVTEKRRLRVMLAGGAAGTLPALVRIVAGGVASATRLSSFLSSGWPDLLIALGFLLFPVSFAYAILRHRLLGVWVIVRLGVQYALAKGLVISLVPALGVALVADALVHGEQPLIEIVRARGWIYTALGVLAVVVHTQRHRMGRAIDQRFFREHYDATRLLREVSDQARRAGSLERAAPGVVARIEAALHQELVAVLSRGSGQPVFRCVAAAPSGMAPPAIDAGEPVIARLRAADRPLHVGGPGEPAFPAGDSAAETDGRHRARVELLVPITMDPGRHEALLACGAKRSQEPYTREDIDSLAAIASSLALLLEGPTPAPDRAGSAFEECPRCGSCYDSGASRCAHEQAPLVPVGMPRTLAGRYRLERRLGRGGMGKVYEAVDLALDRRVAVKVIRDEWVHSTPATARFRREARAVAGFAHQNVVTVYDYGVEAGSRAFLVMELLHGTTMREELRRSGRLDAARTVEIFHGVCGAVEAAHRHHLIHRDLKPDNIFLAEPGGRSDGAGGAGGEAANGGPTVKVLDFGVAKPLPGNEDVVDVEGGTAATEVGVLVGTIGYLSPEQLLGDQPDVSWDLWALAVVAYESLTGTLPFPVASRERWRQLVLAGRCTPLTEHLAGAPARWQAFFTGALALDRAQRPQSAAEFLRDLESALA